jgi:hypothetical protein
MEIGIVGLPQSGKSTLFEIMTGTKSRDLHGETVIRGQATVPDERFERLAAAFPSLKAVPARIPVTDVHAAGEKAWETLRQSLSAADGLLHVVDGFSIPDVGESIAAHRRLEDELVLSDLMVVENRLEKLRKMSRTAMKPLDQLHLAILPRAREQLEAGLPLRKVGFHEDEAFSLRSFSFWTIRPELVVINAAEDNLDLAEAFREKAALDSPVIGICCQLEADLLGLSPEEQREFLAPLGLEEPAFGRVIRAAFGLLGLISFFTIGKDEVKSWVIPAGTRAPRAAGTIHKDFERGFIKAEVVHFEEFKGSGNSWTALKAAGKLRLEGKEYVVRDGDIIQFRFNI